MEDEVKRKLKTENFWEQTEAQGNWVLSMEQKPASSQQGVNRGLPKGLREKKGQSDISVYLAPNE